MALLIAASSESAALIYFNFALRSVKAKYNINLELKNITLAWLFQLIFSLIITALPFSIQNDAF